MKEVLYHLVVSSEHIHSACCLLRSRLKNIPKTAPKETIQLAEEELVLSSLCFLPSSRHPAFWWLLASYLAAGIWTGNGEVWGADDHVTRTFRSSGYFISNKLMVASSFKRSHHVLKITFLDNEPAPMVPQRPSATLPSKTRGRYVELRAVTLLQ